MATEHRAVPARIRLGRPHPDDGPVSTKPHADKAISQRATLLAAIGDGQSHLRNLADCRDTASNLRALHRLGVCVRAEGTSVTIDGVGPGGFDFRGGAVDAGNSATTARLLIAVLAGSRADCVVDGNDLLRNRPMDWLIEPLRQVGADLTCLGPKERLPVRVAGRQLRGGTVDVEIDSAQPVSAMLFAGLAADGEVVIRRRTAARDHTERMLRWTGVDVRATQNQVILTPGVPRAFELTVPGDPSAAAVLAALHLASPRASSPLLLDDVCLNPTRLGFFRALRSLGADITWQERASAGSPEPVGTIEVRGPLRLAGGVVGGKELIQASIDELPLLAALCCRADQPLVIEDAAELRDKDIDRITATVELLTQFGIEASATSEGLIVSRSEPKPPTEVSLPRDHRLVFAGCVLAVLAGGELVLDGVDAAATSYPALVEDLATYVPVEVL